jgi:hypothetical protein
MSSPKTSIIVVRIVIANDLLLSSSMPSARPSAACPRTERPRDTGTYDARAFGDVGDDRAAGARAAAHAGVMNSMSAPVISFGDAIAVFHRRVSGRSAWRPRQARGCRSQLQLRPRGRRLSACASVLAQMNSTPNPLDHVLDRAAAAAAHADALDDGAFVSPGR